MQQAAGMYNYVPIYSFSKISTGENDKYHLNAEGNLFLQRCTE
jgi:hypothetical protein